MKLAILSATVTVACAFAPSSHVGMQTSLRMSDPETGEETTLLTPEQQEFQGAYRIGRDRKSVVLSDMASHIG